MNDERGAFGLRLRRQRESRGVTLKAIADSTKIKQSLLAALERGDVSQWPQGLFRRAYIRDYASAIGLAPQSVVAEFVQIFPEADGPGGESATTEAASSKPHTAEPSPSGNALIRVHNARAAVFDVAVVLLVCGVVGAVTGLTVWTAVGVVALGYATAGTVCFGESIGRMVLRRTDEILRDMPSERLTTSHLRERLSIIQARSPHSPTPADNAAPAQSRPRRASA